MRAERALRALRIQLNADHVSPEGLSPDGLHPCGLHAQAADRHALCPDPRDTGVRRRGSTLVPERGPGLGANSEMLMARVAAGVAAPALAASIALAALSATAASAALPASVDTALAAAPPAAPDAPPVYLDDLDAAKTGPVAVIGDLQETSLAERLLGREKNETEPGLLLGAIAAEKPVALAVLGDMVFDGASGPQWSEMDELFRPLREARVPVLPALGNHEYWGSNSKAIAHLRARFPQIARSRWYSREVGALGLIWLDTNADDLGAADWRRQLGWYRETLGAFEKSARVRGVLVFAHHPPFTNSTVTGDEKHVREAFVGDFLKARKTLAFVSGHAHAYEHFVEGGKHFLVSGGGGGPRVKLLEGDRVRHQDLYRHPSPRPFHYLLVVPGTNGARIVVKGFETGEASAGEAGSGENRAMDKGAGEKGARDKGKAADQGAGDRSAGEKATGDTSAAEKRAGGKSPREKGAGEKGTWNNGARDRGNGDRGAPDKTIRELDSFAVPFAR